MRGDKLNRFSYSFFGVGLIFLIVRVYFFKEVVAAINNAPCKWYLYLKDTKKVTLI